MTTAGKATFVPARGGGGKNEKSYTLLSKQFSSKDLPAQLVVKTRKFGQGSKEELRLKDFRKELLEKELESKRKKALELEKAKIKLKDARDIPGGVPTGLTKIPEDVRKVAMGSDGDRKLSMASEDYRELPISSEDTRELPSISDRSRDFPTTSEDDSDDEAETAALLAELQRIRQERAEAKAKKEAEEREEAENARTNAALIGNPLLSTDNNFLVKRKWNDDVIFKNCARDRDKDKNQKPYFINDMIRSEFHKRFMDRYVK